MAVDSSPGARLSGDLLNPLNQSVESLGRKQVIRRGIQVLELLMEVKITPNMDLLRLKELHKGTMPTRVC